MVCKALRRLCTDSYSIIEVGFFRKLVQEAPISFILSHFPLSFLTSQTLYEDDLLEGEWLNLLPP